MRLKYSFIFTVILSMISASLALGAYHHEGERDADKFLNVYNKKGTKLDHCALCHSGGTGSKGEVGSCQWCHMTYGYDGAGDISETMNTYGIAYKAAGRNEDAIRNIENDDSDGDTYSNKTEIEADRFPGNANDHPGLVAAPYRVYTKKQIMAMAPHTQFMLMNTSRSGDFYEEYTGVPLKDLLDDAGITEAATGVVVYAPDGWSQFHPLSYDAALDMYHVYGNVPGQSYQYPPATYYYDIQADQNKTDIGWCDYSAPSCTGRSHGDPISVSGGLKAILAYQRGGVLLDPGLLNNENKLDGEGPFRVVVPQKYPEAPDQSSKSGDQEVIWPYVYEWDHNAGSCTKSVTIIKVEPLPEGTTDIDVLEAGWSYVDQGKIIVYGAIDGTDSNGNGILDSEEGMNDASDYDEDGIPDYQDADTARLRQANGKETLMMHSSAGSFSDVFCLTDDDPAIPQAGKPDLAIPYGLVGFKISGIEAGETVTVTLVFPYNIPTNAKYYKVDTTGGWREIPFGSNDGDNTITLELTDGDSDTDGDGVADGIITDPGALAVPSDDGGGSGSSLCFINTILE